MVSNKISFVKMHGLGNDFVIIDQQFIAKQKRIETDFIRKIANRKLGIGCDQLIIYQKLADRVIMQIYNQDGSSALACGNATRCLMRLLYDQFNLVKTIIEVQGRLVEAKYYDAQNIEINMGQVSFTADWIPKNANLWSLAGRYMIEPKELICVDVANPHLVIFTKMSEKDRYIIGKAMQASELFPQGINVNFAVIEQQEINLKVWERGVGFTYACGSGAVASFAAANRLGFAGEKALIHFELGSLKMQKKGEHILMSGAAEYVFEGNYFL